MDTFAHRLAKGRQFEDQVAAFFEPHGWQVIPFYLAYPRYEYRGRCVPDMLVHRGRQRQVGVPVPPGG